jgi:radical SAM-linked protein
MVRDQPKQAPPPVQRLRVRYAKRGRLRFTSHRDFSRAFERAVFRARLPMAYSSGFNPHPRISYAGASPTGSASEAEYLELALAEVCDPVTVHAALDGALPDGLDVVEVVESRGGGFGELMQASRWRMVLPVPLAETEAAVGAFLAADEVVVQRMTKKGLRDFDSRAAVLGLTASATDEGAVLELVLRHLEPAVRPDDVLSALASVGGLELVGVPLLTREAQGPLDPLTGEIGDPLRVGNELP